jgi:hypothetical protein
VTETGKSKEGTARSEKRSSGFKIGLWGILRRGECPMVKFYVSKFFTAKRVKRKRA